MTSSSAYFRGESRGGGRSEYKRLVTNYGEGGGLQNGRGGGVKFHSYKKGGREKRVVLRQGLDVLAIVMGGGGGGGA